MPIVNRIIVDADSSPVIHEVIAVAQQYNLNVLLVKDFSHYTLQDYPAFVATHYVDTGNDSADYAIKKHATPNDIIITGDYGLASLLLDRSMVLHHNGEQYTQETIELLLMTRYHNQMERQAKRRIKGPPKFTQQDRIKFVQSLTACIEKNLAH
ncbi:YaiI/YqxD family protein [Macrococcus capreoli]|uniref:YaiI/YqxD family protein n=1 Tax=Macrococcus capreoli TaxID=2982690 RepID=UPI0021D5AA06|nr:YaiI/YqxD family protein [Macrococcus sp. TMW 2.2395]MCU7556239.1 YaiI/YqxD family protein [Macrococcus sp. TMW 2.2395]